MAVMQDILRPSVVTKIVSRIRTPGQVFSRWLGVNIGGENIEKLTIPVRQYTYDIFDQTRDGAKMRAPGVPASTFSPNPVGNNTVSLIRVNEKLPMDYWKIAAIRTIGQNAGDIDIAGKRYIERQAAIAKKRFDNSREIIAASWFNGGKIYLYQKGDDLVPSYTNNSSLYGIDFKFDPQHVLLGGGSFTPGLAMNTGANLITAAWSNVSTDIILQLQAISAAFQEEVGEPLAHVWVNYTVWNNVIQNTLVRQFAGTANEPVFEWVMTEESNESQTRMDGEKPKRIGVQRARLKGMQWLTWHVYDGGLNVYDGTLAFPYTKIVPNNVALFTIETDFGSSGWHQGVEGQEPVKENDLAPPKMMTGFNAWQMEKADPARFELHGLDNFTLELNTPKAVSVAQVQ